MSGSILGTPAFMPPEQARGDWDSVDARSDLWATGATLFTLLTGQHVHLARTAQEQLGMAMMVSPPSVVERTRHCPMRSRKLVDRALEFEQTRRWPSATGHARGCERSCRARSPSGARWRHEGAPRRCRRDPRIDTQKTATLSLGRSELALARLAPRSLAGNVVVAVAVVAAVIEFGAVRPATKPEQRAGRASSAAASEPSAPPVGSAVVRSRVVPGASGERPARRRRSTDLAPRPRRPFSDRPHRSRSGARAEESGHRE